MRKPAVVSPGSNQAGASVYVQRPAHFAFRLRRGRWLWLSRGISDETDDEHCGDQESSHGLCSPFAIGQDTTSPQTT
ncbi:MAG: hypothetical protein DMD96_16810 [Candidatus Rokuibacteriota bacterium]|nr:MAG: hypothetical protein DMD96_16810 [Candidatus Rokubacteria bacterium]